MRLRRDDCRNENGRVKEEIHFKGFFNCNLEETTTSGGWRSLALSVGINICAAQTCERKIVVCSREKTLV